MVADMRLGRFIVAGIPVKVLQVLPPQSLMEQMIETTAQHFARRMRTG